LNPAFRQLTAPNGVVMLSCIPLADSGASHGFSLRFRRTAVAHRTAPFGERGRDREDQQELARALGLRRAIPMRQVHGRDLAVVDGEGRVGACDGLMTRAENVALIARSADCVPLLFWDAEERVAAAVHAGWRGACAGIAAHAVTCLKEQMSVSARSLRVAMGPAIGVCCYEVGEEVLASFRERWEYGDRLFRAGPAGRLYLDLLEANRRQLVGAGVRPERIHTAESCTSCLDQELYSYRREGPGVGRLLAAIGIRPAGGQSGEVGGGDGSGSVATGGGPR
jgi:hypothetical protein